MLAFLIALFVIGVIAGYLARLLVMGPDPMSFLHTVLLGVSGSFVGGIVGSILFQGRLAISPSGLLLAIPGAVIALLIYRKVKFGSIAERGSKI